MVVVSKRCRTVTPIHVSKDQPTPEIPVYIFLVRVYTSIAVLMTDPT